MFHKKLIDKSSIIYYCFFLSLSHVLAYVSGDTHIATSFLSYDSSLCSSVSIAKLFAVFFSIV